MGPSESQVESEATVAEACVETWNSGATANAKNIIGQFARTLRGEPAPTYVNADRAANLPDRCLITVAQPDLGQAGVVVQFLEKSGGVFDFPTGGTASISDLPPGSTAWNAQGDADGNLTMGAPSSATDSSTAPDAASDDANAPSRSEDERSTADGEPSPANIPCGEVAFENEYESGTVDVYRNEFGACHEARQVIEDAASHRGRFGSSAAEGQQVHQWSCFGGRDGADYEWRCSTPDATIFEGR